MSRLISLIPTQVKQMKQITKIYFLIFQAAKITQAEVLQEANLIRIRKEGTEAGAEVEAGVLGKKGLDLMQKMKRLNILL